MKAVSNRVSNHYPRSLPYQAPEDLRPRLRNLRRWNIMLVMTTCILFVGLVAAVVALVNRPQPVVEEVVETPMPPRLPPLAASLAKLPQQTAVPVKAADTGRPEAFLEALGGLSAVHLYQSYLNIGLVADAVEKDVYRVAEAGKILKTVEDLMDSVDQRLTRLAKTDLEPDDQQALEHIRTVTQQLRQQANALKGFWAGGDTENINRYRQARARCWEELRDILGID